MYYNGDKILNRKQPFNFLLGNRGIGKSYYWKRYCIRQFLDKNRKFIYVRRYKSDLDKVVSNLFDDVLNQFDKYGIVFEKGKFYITSNDGIKLDCGLAIAVSEFTKYKSANFEDYDTIMFDEFLPEDGKYLGGKDRPFLEPELCLNFYQTVARGYNKPIRDEVLFLFISNSVTINNPYFQFYNIDKRLRPETKFLKGEGFNVEVNNNLAISKEIANSKFGQLVKGTRYERYALNNDFYLDNNEFIGESSGKKIYAYSLVYNGTVFGVYKYVDTGIWFISDTADMDYPYKYSLTLKDHSFDAVMLSHLDDKFKNLRKQYAYGMLYFKNQRCKTFFESIIK